VWLPTIRRNARRIYWSLPESTASCLPDENVDMYCSIASLYIEELRERGLFGSALNIHEDIHSLVNWQSLNLVTVFIPKE
jgi:hypothetical protein